MSSLASSAADLPETSHPGGGNREGNIGIGDDTSFTSNHDCEDSSDCKGSSNCKDTNGFGAAAPLPGKPPQLVFPNLVAFPPNRKTLGGTAYLIQTSVGNLLVDSPPWTVATQDYLRAAGGVRWLFLTHRTAMAEVKTIQAALGCEVIVQEQEAYLLPEMPLRPFGQTLWLDEGLWALWTPGHSPGSACLYWAGQGGVLFTGRHLLPNGNRDLMPLRTSKTFHWQRQLRSVAVLRDRFAPGELPLSYVCPGASLGFLRGEYAVDQAGQRLGSLDLEQLAQLPIGL